MSYSEDTPNQVGFTGYSIYQHGKGPVDLEVDYRDSYYGPCTVDLDAVEVYRNLKEYFKGTEYE